MEPNNLFDISILNTHKKIASILEQQTNNVKLDITQKLYENFSYKHIFILIFIIIIFFVFPNNYLVHPSNLQKKH